MKHQIIALKNIKEKFNLVIPKKHEHKFNKKEVSSLKDQAQMKV